MTTVRLAIFVSSFLLVTPLKAQLYGWDNNYYVPGLGRDDAVCFTLDEIVFVGTGNHGGFSESNTFYAINTRNGQWQDVAQFPGAPRQYAQVEEVGFKAFLIGGIDEVDVPLNEVWEYDLVNDEWSQKSNFPGAARWKAASFVVDGFIYYGTGRDWNSCFNDLWRYDPVTDQWKKMKDLPVLPRNEAVGFSLYDKGYIGLGMDCTNVMLQDIWTYDPINNSWLFETDFPGGPRWYAIAEGLNGFAFIGTGEDEDGIMHNDFWKYHPGTKVWEKVANLPNPPRRGAYACVIPFKGIFVACGLSDSFQRLTDISRYTNRNINPPDLNVFYQEQERKIYINDLPYYSFVKAVDVSGKLLFESNRRADHVCIDVTNWDAGIYIIWSAGKSARIYVY